MPLKRIDENLCRNELSPAERATQTARRKAIYAELHPETSHGGDRASRQLGDLKEERFTASTAAATGQSERAVQRDAERGTKVIAEVIDTITGTKLEAGTYPYWPFPERKTAKAVKTEPPAQVSIEHV